MVHPWRIAARLNEYIFLDEDLVAHGGFNKGRIQNGLIRPDDDGLAIYPRMAKGQTLAPDLRVTSPITLLEGSINTPSSLHGETSWKFRFPPGYNDGIKIGIQFINTQLSKGPMRYK
jgi:hypothetical protein